MTAVQAKPARTSVEERDDEARGLDQPRRRDGEEHPGDTQQPIRRQVVPDASEDQRGDDGTDSEGTEQCAVAARPEAQLLACHQRQQRPQHHRGSDEQRGPQQDPPDDRFVPARSDHRCAAPARTARDVRPTPHGRRRQNSSATARKITDAAFMAKTSETPDQAMTRPARAGPAARDRLTPTISSRVAERSSDRGTSSGMTDCQVGSCTAVPAASAHVNVEQERGRHLTGDREDDEHDADDEEVDLHGEQQPAAVEGVGEHPARQRQQHDRHRVRRLDERDGERGVRRVQQQPLGADHLHPVADIADEHADPQPPERAVRAAVPTATTPTPHRGAGRGRSAGWVIAPPASVVRGWTRTRQPGSRAGRAAFGPGTARASHVRAPP